MIEIILNPPIPLNYNDFFKTLLSVSGVLFGLTFAGLLFILQNGFSSFTFTRRMFLILYLHFGRQLLYSLSFLTFLPFVFLYFPNNFKLITIIYLIFFILLFHAVLDHAKEEGYLSTIFGNKFVPRKYGKIRSYFRYIKNRGFFRNIFHFIPILFMLLYPFYLSIREHQSLILTDRSIFYSCLLIFLFTLLRVAGFIPEYFRYQEMELKNEKSSEIQIDEKSAVRNLQAKQALLKHLKGHQILELGPTESVEFLEGTLNLDFLSNNDNDEAFFNAWVSIKTTPPDVVRESVLLYAHHFFKYLHNSGIDLNKFVLSFHIDNGEQKSRNIFLRVTRNELDNLFSIPNSIPNDLLKIKNYLIDDLYKP